MTLGWLGIRLPKRRCSPLYLPAQGTRTDHRHSAAARAMHAPEPAVPRSHLSTASMQ